VGASGMGWFRLRVAGRGLELGVGAALIALAPVDAMRDELARYAAAALVRPLGPLPGAGSSRRLSVPAPSRRRTRTATVRPRPGARRPPRAARSSPPPSTFRRNRTP